MRRKESFWRWGRVERERLNIFSWLRKEKKIEEDYVCAYKIMQLIIRKVIIDEINIYLWQELIVERKLMKFSLYIRERTRSLSTHELITRCARAS